MRYLTLGAAFVILSAAAVFSLLQWKLSAALEGADSIRADLRAALNAQPVSGFAGMRISAKALRERALSEARRINESLFAPARAAQFLTNMLRAAAEEERDPQKQVALYCQALSSIGSNLTRRPWDGGLLVSWANLRQILGGTGCREPFTGGDYREALRVGLRQDPTNIDLRYAAGLIFLWGNERREAFESFHQTLLFGTKLSDRQKDLIFSLINDSESLSQIVPPRFPQVIDYSRFFVEKMEKADRAGPEDERWRRLTETLVQMQLKAVEGGLAEYSSGAVPVEIHRGRLLALMRLSGSSDVRRRVDFETANLMKESLDSQLASYFAERSRYDELAVIRASAAGDTRPLKSPLVNWDKQESLALDNFFRSIGFYLPQGQTAKLIQLESSNSGSSAIRTSLRVMRSVDNQNWEEVTASLAGEAFDLEGRTIVSYKTNLAQGAFKYWKINFSGSAREGSFTNTLSGLIKIYGFSSRKPTDRGMSHE